MPSVAQLADHRYRQGILLRTRADRAVSSLWKRLDLNSPALSWAVYGPAVVGAVSLAQKSAASGSDEYVNAVLAAQNADPEGLGRVNPEAFSGVASDGRSLDTLLATPLFTVKESLRQGNTRAAAMAHGLAALRLITRTQVQDAGRVADGVAIAARPRTGYVRMLSLPSCPKCAVLAGEFYRFSAGFQRHPNCDCRHIPAAESLAGDLTTDPMKAFRSGQIRGLTQAETKALNEGADISRVVNVKRNTGSVYTAGGKKYTTELRTKYGARITPEQIYRDATSREDAVRLLRLHGYII